jgi:predicted deacylase
MTPEGSVDDAETSGLAEIDELLQLVRDGGEHLACRVICEVATGNRTFAVHAVTLGNPDPAVPAVGIFGGVHGLERIGAEVALACLRSLVRRLRWDATLHHILEGLRVVVVPIVNPGGLWRGTRANPQGVDLMRNAPVDSIDGAAFLLGGQRVSPGLPWYRGTAGAPMQPEAQALCEVVESELLAHDFAISIDCHSGFGMNDRLWFPFAHTARPVEHLAELHALSRLLDATLLHHRYLFEPQSRQYLAHGDLWDHLYRRAASLPGRVFLPLTLEMGSWLWVKKNPRQFFSRRGIFNPLIEHRQHRVLRRHLALLDFAMRAAYSHRRWIPQDSAREEGRQLALGRWYGAQRR